jgi:cyclopropane fatty-acyl-phospholipid synthase-like methyltransferase
MRTSSEIGVQYDEAYYERGVETGKSCYSNYRWLPDLTIPMAMTLIDAVGIRATHTVLDFGCAKGYCVKAFRTLRREAFGIDVSPYAIENVDAEVAPYCSLVGDLEGWSLTHRYDHVIAKDVLEHVPYDEIDATIQAFARMTDSVLVVVPLGEGGRYIIPAYEADVTHQIRESAEWWCDRFERCFAAVKWTHHVPGLKDNWHKVNAQGNAVLFARGALR